MKNLDLFIPVVLGLANTVALWVLGLATDASTICFLLLMLLWMLYAGLGRVLKAIEKDPED